MVVSQSTVIRIIKEKELEGLEVVNSPPDHSKCGKEKRRLPVLINKVKKGHLRRQFDDTKSAGRDVYKVSKRTIRRIIHQDDRPRPINSFPRYNQSYAYEPLIILTQP